MIRKNLQIIGLVILLGTTVSAQIDPGSFGANVKNISAGETAGDRRAQIIGELYKLEVKFSVEPFTGQTRGGEVKGWNVIAEIPNAKAAKTIMIGAHYDRVAKGKGAVDNASGSAAILELLKAFKARPLQNVSLKVAFWDFEEVGLIGSSQYIKARTESELPLVYINFDVFGYGDTIWLFTKDDNAAFVKSVSENAGKAGVKIRAGKEYPPSDHLTFARTKAETYSFSLIGGEEIPDILKEFSGVKLENPPRVLQIIHSDNDTADKIDANAAAKALPAIEQAIRSLDK